MNLAIIFYVSHFFAGLYGVVGVCSIMIRPIKNTHKTKDLSLSQNVMRRNCKGNDGLIDSNNNFII